MLQQEQMTSWRRGLLVSFITCY